NKLRSEEAAGSGTPVEICFKLLKRVLGHLRGRSAPKKEILAVKNLKEIAESEKNKSAALEEKLKEVTVEQDEMKKSYGMILAESYLADSSKCLMPCALGMPGDMYGYYKSHKKKAKNRTKMDTRTDRRWDWLMGRVVQSTGEIKGLKKQSRLRAKMRAGGACIGS
nr:hypothetical protein [Tanacetum cinerariifolium]